MRLQNDLALSSLNDRKRLQQCRAGRAAQRRVCVNVELDVAHCKHVAPISSTNLDSTWQFKKHKFKILLLFVFGSYWQWTYASVCQRHNQCIDVFALRLFGVWGRRLHSRVQRSAKLVVLVVIVASTRPSNCTPSQCWKTKSEKYYFKVGFKLKF